MTDRARRATFQIGAGVGAPVHGIPAGGDFSQVLTKKSAADYDVEWKNAGVIGAYDRFVVPVTPSAIFGLSFLPTATFALSKNGSMLAEGYDFTVDYSAAVVTLAVVPTAGDVIAISYETDGTTIVIPSGGLIAWWRADTIGQADGSPVATWTDFTANHWTAVQGSAPSRPTFAAAPAGFNGQPAVLFSGGQELDAPYDPILNPTDAMTIASVFNNPNDGITGFIAGMRDTSGGGSSGVGYELTKTFNNHLTAFGLTCGVAASPPTMWAVAGGDNNTPEAWAYLNGALGQAVATPQITPDPVHDPFRIGNDPNFGLPHPYNGYIAEIIMWDRLLSAIERAQVDAYVRNKYGL